QAALDRGADPAVTGALVDEQYGGPSQVPEGAKDAGIKLAMPVEKSGQTEFDFEYGDDFGAHIESFDPDFSKVLVRYNPEGDGDMCVVLGRGADDDKVDHWLRQGAPVDGYVGFAIGRSIWGGPLAGFLDGSLSREGAAAKVADNYLRFVEVYRAAEQAVVS